MNKLNQVLLLGMTFGLTACGGGGGGNSSSSNNGGGASKSLNIQIISVISPLLNTTYSPTCIYSYGNTTFLVNSDGSGSGYSLRLNNGQVSQAANFPRINAATGDRCLDNVGQLTWYNTSNPYQVNIFDPDSNQTTTVNLSKAGIDGSSITTSSYNYDIVNKFLYSNNNFLNNSYAGFSKFNLNVSPVTSFLQLTNTGYNNMLKPVLFGFYGSGSSFFQLYPADTSNNIPASLVTVTVAGGGNPEQQSVLPITDIRNQPISAMTTAWDMAATGQGLIITTGAVQPVLYNCSGGSGKFVCNKTYTDPILTSQYRIMRLLGANSNTLYFMGVDLNKGNLDIFSMSL